jgi:hypothetical protein
VAAMFVNDQDKMSNPYREPSIDASYQVSVHLAKRFQRRRFLEIDKKIFYSEAAWRNGLKHGRKYLWKVLYGNCSFRFDPLTNMAFLEIDQLEKKIACGSHSC